MTGAFPPAAKGAGAAAAPPPNSCLPPHPASPAANAAPTVAPAMTPGLVPLPLLILIGTAAATQRVPLMYVWRGSEERMDGCPLFLSSYVLF